MKLCIALDLPSAKENLQIVKASLGKDVWLKVGFRSFIRDGAEFLKEIKTINPNAKIFLDLKLYDIPNTMADASEEIAALGVDMFNIHASAGEAAMRAVMERLNTLPSRPLVLAVTALTSFDDDAFTKLYGANIETKATEFARMSFEAGLDGVVCSAYESRAIKQVTSDEFLTLTPGIRPFGEEKGDQSRVADLAFAKEMGVDFPVVGRAIYKDSDPAQKIEMILREIAKLEN
ncbi:MAG: orotidine-5'-phosphate decarboxylase [Sulfurovaceae bacterium]